MHDAPAPGARGVVIDGIDTTIPLHQALIANRDFANGDYDVTWLESCSTRETERQ